MNREGFCMRVQIAPTAAPFGPHTAWLAAHDRCLSASSDRLVEGKYPAARALYHLASWVRWEHEQQFQMGEHRAQGADMDLPAGAHEAYGRMWYPQVTHPLEALHAIMDANNAKKRASKVHAIFSTRCPEYVRAEHDKSQVEEWLRGRIVAFNADTELVDYVARMVNKWRAGYKVAPNDPDRCTRCGGTGITAFKHVSQGVCFECDGTGKQ